MRLLGLFPCFLFVIVTGSTVPKANQRTLKWPKEYTMSAEKVSLTSGSVEDLQFWRSEGISRMDYNKGAVKVIIEKSNYSHCATMYEVHPKTTDDEENERVCIKTSCAPTELDDILPKIDKFKQVETEIIENESVQKLIYSETYKPYDMRCTLWATYNQENDTWIPVRYELITYDMWLESHISHIIWNFYNYETNFNYSMAFNFEDYDCENSSEYYENANFKSHNINPENEDHLEHAFSSFKRNHHKLFENEEEHSFRRNLFQQRMRLVLENNHNNTGYKLAINKFADRTPGEMKRYMGLIRPSQTVPDTHPFPYTKSEVVDLAKNLPKEFDLRNLGLVTPAEDQSACGSCWAFGVISTVEGVLARNNGGRLLKLSNQALIDCAWDFGLNGCNGGLASSAYRWIMGHGLPTEEEYGFYTDQVGYCHNHNMTETYKIRGYTNVTPYSIEALKVALVNHGPISIGIDASDAFMLYRSGIFYDTECDPYGLNHMVTLVGYGERDGEEFWIIKNSWGHLWGIDGYAYISVRDNNCGITTEPSYPVV